MHLDLGVGLGGTTAVAAVLRRAAAGRPEVVLSRPAAPTGDPAERDALHRVGDRVPLHTAGGPRAAADVVAATVRDLVGRTTAAEGGPPRTIALARPGTWGAHRDRDLTLALARAGLEGVLLVVDADAAVDATPAVRTGELVAVVHVGASATRLQLVRRRRGRGDGEDLRVTDTVGAPAGPVGFGGTDVDDAVLDHVRDAVGEFPAASDPGTRRALAVLRHRAVAAKEALATAEDTVLDVELPGLRARVGLTRAELDRRVTPLVERAVAALRDGLPADVRPDAVVLTGGTARLPVVAGTAAATLGVDARPQPDPATLPACGAARAAGVHAARVRRAARGDRPQRVALTATSATSVTSVGPGPEPIPGPAPTPDGDAAAVPSPPEAEPTAQPTAEPTPGLTPEPDPGVGRRPGADVPRPPVLVAPVPDEVRASRAPGGRGRLALAAAAVVLALGAVAATVPVPGLTRGATSPPRPVAGTAPASTGAPVPALVLPSPGATPTDRSPAP